MTVLPNEDTGLRDWPFLPSRAMRVVRGEGAWLVTDEGRRILDAAGAIVVNVGVAHRRATMGGTPTPPRPVGRRRGRRYP